MNNVIAKIYTKEITGKDIMGLNEDAFLKAQNYFSADHLLS